MNAKRTWRVTGTDKGKPFTLVIHAVDWEAVNAYFRTTGRRRMKVESIVLIDEPHKEDR